MKKKEKEESKMDVEMQGIERQGLHSTAFSILFHKGIINDLELIEKARIYLIQLMSIKN